MKYHIWTVGCQMNVADSRKLAAGLDRAGLVATDGDGRCRSRRAEHVLGARTRGGPRDRAARAAEEAARRAGRDFTIAVMGCMVGPRHDDLQPPLPVRRRVRAAAGVLPDPQRRGCRRHRRRVLAGHVRRARRRHRVRAGGARLRQVLHVLHRAVPAGARTQPHGRRYPQRSRALLRARRARGDAARANGRGVRQRSRRRRPRSG